MADAESKDAVHYAATTFTHFMGLIQQQIMMMWQDERNAIGGDKLAQFMELFDKIVETE